MSDKTALDVNLTALKNKRLSQLINCMDFHIEYSVLPDPTCNGKQTLHTFAIKDGRTIALFGGDIHPVESSIFMQGLLLEFINIKGDRSCLSMVNWNYPIEVLDFILEELGGLE